MASTPPNGVIEIDHLWKRFRSDRRRPVLRDEIGRISDALRGRGDERRWRWALRDLNVRIEAGEAVGLFGTNGSGKSTLLKMLTKVMYPTAGQVRLGGRVGALIEIKAGVHPDLTGRENVYLYGSIMGLSRHEIDRRFDAIVDFAELNEALDRQLKYYSSGMAMRLGFAVAAFLQPHVLLVDEVLAVGDATFQQKCLDRMRAVLQEGTTLVFVSHDLASIEAIAKRGLWLRDGVLAADGPIRESIGAYRRHIESVAELEDSNDRLIRSSVSVSGTNGHPPASGQPVRFRLRMQSDIEREVSLFLGVSEGSAAPIFTFKREVRMSSGLTTLDCTISSVPLPGGRYWIWMAITDLAGSDLVPWHPSTTFDVLGPDLDPLLPGIMRLSPVHVDARWEQADDSQSTALSLSQTDL